MKKRNRILLLFSLILILLIAGFLWRVPPIANGYTAKYLCSLTYTSGLDLEKAYQHYVKPMHFMFGLAKPEADPVNKTVTAKLFGFLRPRTAVWREGCGCTLLVDHTPQELKNQHHIPHRKSGRDLIPDPNALWPEGNHVSRDSLSSTIDWSAIDAILDAAMDETTDDPRKRYNTLALVVAWKGRIVGEHYAEGLNENTPLLGWSAAKSITGALTGVMVAKHGLDIYAPVGLPDWTDEVRKEITVDHLLRMESGLEFEENYALFADATQMLYTSADMGRYAAAKPAISKPGERWEYSSGTTNILADVLYNRIGGTPEALHRLAYDSFFDRLGITTAIFEHDESDAFVGSSYLYMSARDWLRVCKLYMNDGMWNGDRILPEGWVRYSLTPTPNAPDGRYGAQIWLNASTDPDLRRLPALPADTFIFRGFQDQWIIGIPSLNLMLVRLGVTHADTEWSPEEVILKVSALLEEDSQ